MSSTDSSLELERAQGQKAKFSSVQGNAFDFGLYKFVAHSPMLRRNESGNRNRSSRHCVVDKSPSNSLGITPLE